MSDPGLAQRHVRVVAALIPDPRKADHFLIQQRSPHGSRPMLWEFPGGKVEAGETDEGALARECQEELGVEISVGKYVASSVHHYPEVTVELVLYEARVLQGNPQPLGAHALAYVPRRQMREVAFCEADLPLLEAIENRGA